MARTYLLLTGSKGLGRVVDFFRAPLKLRFCSTDWGNFDSCVFFRLDAPIYQFRHAVIMGRNPCCLCIKHGVASGMSRDAA
ncbi:hypothetical protein K788_00007815 (plasmid) [Paraburkholderia caribensis MBA4]|uniref:Uncharacterized protein n=1 Tax=Paraburkholderia caribensis MBA4 TaxID=1323664 RepID=A0A0P0RMW3_9BURK|nr:hypothetical protein K788_00007815 [Paraburkholderia caribensis MBA4]